MAIRLGHAGSAPGGTQPGNLAGNVPTGTYEVWISVVNRSGINPLHPVCSFCQNINHKLLVYGCPSPHPSVRIDNRLDVVLDVFFLSALVVERNRTESQGLKNRFDIGLGSAGDADAEVWEF